MLNKVECRFINHICVYLIFSRGHILIVRVCLQTFMNMKTLLQDRKLLERLDFFITETTQTPNIAGGDDLGGRALLGLKYRREKIYSRLLGLLYHIWTVDNDYSYDDFQNSKDMAYLKSYHPTILKLKSIIPDFEKSFYSHLKK